MGESTRLLKGTVPEQRVAFTPEEQAEFNAWDQLSVEAWASIDWGEGEIARDSG